MPNFARALICVMSVRANSPVASVRIPVLKQG
jgi:hypothetical protein